MAEYVSHPDLPDNVKKAHAYLSDLGTARILVPGLEDVRAVHAAFVGSDPQDKLIDKRPIDSPPGVLKTGANFIGLEGNRFMHFCPPDRVVPAYEELLEEMRRLQARLKIPADSTGDDPLKILKFQYVASFHVRFMYIHPFADGNGRVGRSFALFQLIHLFGDELDVFPPTPRYWTKEMEMDQVDPMTPVSPLHSREAYFRAMGQAATNLVYTARFFNWYYPALVFPPHLPPPDGTVQDIRDSPP